MEINSQTWECLRNFQSYFEPADEVYKAVDVYFAKWKEHLTQTHKNALSEVLRLYGKHDELYRILCEAINNG